MPKHWIQDRIDDAVRRNKESGGKRQGTPPTLNYIQKKARNIANTLNSVYENYDLNALNSTLKASSAPPETSDGYVCHLIVSIALRQSKVLSLEHDIQGLNAYRGLCSSYDVLSLVATQAEEGLPRRVGNVAAVHQEEHIRAETLEHQEHAIAMDAIRKHLGTLSGHMPAGLG